MATLTDTKEPEAKTCISMEEWIDVWGTVVGKAKRMDDLPMWLQYYPKVLFDIINRSGNCHVRGHRYNYRILDAWHGGTSPLSSLYNNRPLDFLLATGVITKSELKYFYTAFMDVGKLGEIKLDEITNNAYQAMTSVIVTPKSLCNTRATGFLMHDCLFVLILILRFLRERASNHGTFCHCFVVLISRFLRARASNHETTLHNNLI
jgi:hypothetical protein